MRAGRASACAAIGIAAFVLGGVHPAGASTAPAAGADPAVRAQSAAVLSGTVKDAKGRPVAGAAFVLTRKADGSAVAETVTGADGGFALSGLSAAEYVVRITPPAGSGAGELSQAITISTDAEQRVGVVFWLPAAAPSAPADTPAPTTPPAQAGPPSFPVVTISRVTPTLAPTLAPKGKSVKVSRTGDLSLPVTCAPRARCIASVSILASSQAGKAGAKSKLVVLGSGKIDTKAERSSFTPRLNTAGRKRLKASGKVKVTVRVTPKNRHAAITDVKLTLRAK